MSYSDGDIESDYEGGTYRTKRFNTKEKALKYFVKVLMNRGYSEKGAKMLFGKEEKNIKRKLKSLVGVYLGKKLKGKKGGVYRTKRFSDKDKSSKHMIKVLRKRGYTKKQAEKLFNDEEKSEKKIRTLTAKRFKAKKKNLSNPWIRYLHEKKDLADDYESRALFVSAMKDDYEAWKEEKGIVTKPKKEKKAKKAKKSKKN